MPGDTPTSVHRFRAAVESGDMERAIALLADDVVFSSPRALDAVGAPTVRGKAALRRYWTIALERVRVLRFEVGVIAGTRPLNLFGALLIRAPSDGTVSVRSTRLEGMTDFATVPVSHTFIMESPRVARLVVAFLRDGRFHGP